MGWGIESIFSVVGGTLGFIAFFRETFASIASANKEKWRLVEEEVLSEDTLLELLEDLLTHQVVAEPHLQEIELLLDWIKEDAIELQFKHLIRDPCKGHLKDFAVTANSLSKSIRDQKGAWRYYPKVLYPGPPAYYRVYPPNLTVEEHKELEKRFFRTAHEAADLVRALRKTYRKLKVLAERESFEFIAPWKW